MYQFSGSENHLTPVCHFPTGHPSKAFEKAVFLYVFNCIDFQRQSHVNCAPMSMALGTNVIDMERSRFFELHPATTTVKKNEHTAFKGRFLPSICVAFFS